MSTESAEQMAAFKAASDRAFAEMKARTDQEMAKFLSSYGGADQTQGQLGLVPLAATPAAKGPPPSQATPPSQPTPAIRSAPVEDSLKKAMEVGESLMEGVTPDVQIGALNRSHLADTQADLFNDFSQLSQQAKTDVHNTAKEALQGTSEILRGAGSDLGKRAKAEAEALRDAARRAVEEERSLNALRGRAKEELAQAKQRLQAQAAEAKNEAFAKFQSLAGAKLEELKDAAGDTAEAGRSSLQRELNDLMSGEDTP